MEESLDKGQTEQDLINRSPFIIIGSSPHLAQSPSVCLSACLSLQHLDNPTPPTTWVSSTRFAVERLSTTLQRPWLNPSLSPMKNKQPTRRRRLPLRNLITTICRSRHRTKKKFSVTPTKSLPMPTRVSRRLKQPHSYGPSQFSTLPLHGELLSFFTFTYHLI